MKLSDFSLLKEHDDHYIIGHPKGKSMQIPKHGLSGRAQELISKLKRQQHLAEGTTEEELMGESELPIQSPPLTTQPMETVAPQSSYGTVTGAIEEPELISEPAKKALEIVNIEPPEVAAPAKPALEITKVEPEKVTPVPKVTKPPLEREPKAIASMEESLATQQKAGAAQKKIFEAAGKAIEGEKTANEVLKDFQTKDAALSKAFSDNVINPDRYLNSMDTGSRIISAIAMILGGIGTGLVGGTNPAVDQMNDAITRDIEAQKADQSKAMNLWKMNREAYNNEQQANLATKNQLLTVAEVKAKAAAASLPGAVEQARIAPLILAIETEKLKNNWLLSRAMGTNSGNEQEHINDMNMARRLDPKLYEDMQSKYLPGVGTARIDLTPKDREGLMGLKSLENRINEAINVQTNKAGPFGSIPGFDLAARAENIRNSLVVELNKLYGLSTLNHAEYQNFEAQVPNVASFFQSSSLTKLSDLKSQLNDKRHTLETGYGITPFKQSPEDLEALNWAIANPGPKADLILQRLGKK